MSFMNAKEARPVEDPTALVPFGWAPGDYHCAACSTCGEAHSGSDKRSLRCQDCAEKLRDDSMTAPMPETISPREKVFVSATCDGETCHCGAPAVRKVGEEISYDDPNPRRHNHTAYVCARHYAELMGPSGARSVGYAARASSGDHAELARLAEAATPGDLDTVPNPPSEYGGHSTGSYECPACQGAGEVEGETYCNFDGLALGVQFFGIGNAFKNYEAYFRAANPATVLSLIAEVAALRGELDWMTRDRNAVIGERDRADTMMQSADDRATEAERKLAEAVGLMKIASVMFHPGSTVGRDIRNFLSKEAERG